MSEQIKGAETEKEDQEDLPVPAESAEEVAGGTPPPPDLGVNDPSV